MVFVRSRSSVYLVLEFVEVFETVFWLEPEREYLGIVSKHFAAWFNCSIGVLTPGVSRSPLLMRTRFLASTLTWTCNWGMKSCSRS
jgi:hypothetical protein